MRANWKLHQIKDLEGFRSLLRGNKGLYKAWASELDCNSTELVIISYTKGTFKGKPRDRIGEVWCDFNEVFNRMVREEYSGKVFWMDRNHSRRYVDGYEGFSEAEFLERLAQHFRFIVTPEQGSWDYESFGQNWKVWETGRVAQAPTKVEELMEDAVPASVEDLLAGVSQVVECSVNVSDIAILTTDERGRFSKFQALHTWMGVPKDVSVPTLSNLPKISSHYESIILRVRIHTGKPRFIEVELETGDLNMELYYFNRSSRLLAKWKEVYELGGKAAAWLA